ncbi:MAG: hypothetical protein K8W52_32640 [Deltaproteobacteria bacterium]|nr:hypothetical protein [Deltaproteobacteria bacterium]
MAGLVAGLGGCPAGTNPGAPDGGADGNTGTGLTFSWQSVPTIPGDVGGGASIDEAQLIVRNLRAIGDSAPGDERTTTPMATLLWNGQTTPAAINYPLAPPGLYSHVELRADGGLFDALVIHGHAVQGGTTYPFELEVDGPISMSLPLSLELPAGGSASARIDIDLGAVVDTIDWETATIDDGKLRYEASSSSTAAAALKAGVTVSAPQ